MLVMCYRNPSAVIAHNNDWRENVLEYQRKQSRLYFDPVFSYNLTVEIDKLKMLQPH